MLIYSIWIDCFFSDYYSHLLAISICRNEITVARQSSVHH